MRTFTDNEPLTDAELDRLGDFLEGCKSGKAMNVEQLDGFFGAIIAGPEAVMPSEYNREVFGGEMSDAREFFSLEVLLSVGRCPSLRSSSPLCAPLRQGHY